MKEIKVFVILLIMLSFGALTMIGPAASVTTSDTGVSNSAVIYQDGKPVSQVVGPIGSSTVQPFDNGTYQYLIDAYDPHVVSHALINWTISGDHIDMTFATYLNGAFVNYDTLSFNASSSD